jgi:rhomboid protease GluP
VTQNFSQPQQRMQPEPRSLVKPSLRQRFRRFPAAFSLIGITFLIYIAQETSVLLIGDDLVIYFGAKINEAIYAGEIWRFITPIFVHAGIWHIFINMYSLYALGPTVEGFFSTPRMLVIYFFSGVSSVTFSLAFSPYPSVGASGAIFGLLGALGTFLFLHRESLGHAGKTYLRQIVIVALLNLGLGLAPNIDNWGHLGGLLAGIALAWFLGPRFEVSWISNDEPAKLIQQRPWSEVWPRTLPAAFVLILLAYLAILSPFGK